ncbi:uncharacterized protein LOC123560444 [Mercenaria mercenaria]|uniref:uncharacterized protein LOC123560444 n=1 Tax=Mercenaria mercenaria TaxID=6596 RepID=UPI00234E9151|nr:uncharacterized protein LOC123560444 [Mercenaria mercenaria]
MMANRYFALAVSLGTLTTLLSILSLSLDYWQGKTLSGKEIIRIVDGFKNVGQNPLEEYREDTTASISSMGDMILESNERYNSPWADAVINTHVGIWHMCVKVVENPTAPGMVYPDMCTYLATVPGIYFPTPTVWVDADWKVPRAMLFLGLFSIVGSTVCIFVRWFMRLEKHILLSIAAGLALVAGVFFVAGFSYFADTMKLDFLDYQSAFYFCILSWLLSWITGGIIIKTRLSNYDINIA